MVNAIMIGIAKLTQILQKMLHGSYDNSYDDSYD